MKSNIQQVETATVYQTALRLLTNREHSCLELKNKLLQKGLPRDKVEAVLAELEQQKLLNDNRFCEIFIRSRIAKGQGPLRIKEELRQRGIVPEMVDHHFNDAAIDWREQILAVRQKRFGKQWPKDFNERAKQIRFLQYRGFDLEQIQWALKLETDNFNK